MNGLPDSEWKKFAKFDQDPPEAKVCFYNEKKLSSTADFEHFKNNKIEFGMKINVQIYKGGETISMSATSMDSIQTIKEKISEKSGIPIERQRLLFLGKPLENKETLSSYKISSSATLMLEQKQPAEDFSFLELVEIRDGAKDFQDQYGFGVDVRMPSGITITLKVKASYTIGSIKNEITNNKGIPSDRQKIKFAGQELKDDRSLADYNIPKKALLHVVDEGSIGLRNSSQIEIEGWLRDVRVLYQEKTFVLNVKTGTMLKEFKKAMAEISDCSFGEIMFMYGGRILSGDERALADFRIEDYSSVILVPRSNVGDCFRFLEMMRNTRIEEDIQSLQRSLDFLDVSQDLEEYIPNALNVIQNLKKSNPNVINNNVSENGILAIMLWVSNILNTQLNQGLSEGGGDFSQWNVYLKHLLNGIKSMPYYKGKAYAGFFNYQDHNIYKKGNFVDWIGVTTLTKNKQRAQLVTNETGTFFEVDVLSSKDISAVSIYGLEDVLMLPYSCFEVIDVVESPGNPVYVKLRETSVPREQKVVFWVDDKPENNFKLAKEVEENDISCVFCISTKDALREIEKYRWLLYFEEASFRVVTDMVREEDGKMNYTAGVDLVEKLFRDEKYNFEVLIFCNDLKRAQETCDARNLKGRFSITNDKKIVRKFLNFQS